MNHPQAPHHPEIQAKQLPLRFVTAASLFDGHDASINIMRRILQDQGVEVIHLGHDRSVQDIVNAAIQEDAHGIAVSSYQGGHMEFFKYMVDLLKENDFKKPLAYITQTTLSVDDTAEIIEALKNKFPKIKGPIKEDICYATTNRQSAVKEIASKCDMFFVVGSRNSSNSVRLVEVAKKAGCNNSHLMHSEKEIPFNEIENSETIGISSGASAPEKLVQTLLDSLRKDRNVSIEEVMVAEEKVVFKLPKELN